MPAERKVNSIAPEANALEQALRAAGLDPDGALSYPIWDRFVYEGLRVALAAIEERNTSMIENKMDTKPLGGQRQQRSADGNPLGLSEADRAHLRSGGRIYCEKQADGSTSKRYVRGPHGTKTGASAPSSSRPASARPKRQPSKAELQAIHDRWLSPEAQLLADVQRTTTAVDHLLELNEEIRRGRH